VPADQVMDFSIIKKLQAEEKYASQKDEYQIKFTPETSGVAGPRGEQIVTYTVRIHFFPNSWDLNKKITKLVDGRHVEELYDPTVDAVLEDIAKHVGQFGAARIQLEGHTDSSMRGTVPEDLVKELSLNRANAVKEALVRKYSFDPNQFIVRGFGWERPADPDDPRNHPKNRRVEVHVLAPEAQ